jgi:hypothetical protein
LRCAPLKFRVQEHVQARRGRAGEAQQHRLAPRRAERSKRGLAHDLAGEPVGQDQPFALRQQR